MENTRFVATHHRVMTTYFSAVLRLLSLATKSPFAKQNYDDEVVPRTILLSMHSKIDFAAIAPYRGVHVMRDPRDVVVSSYYYHKWTNEPWAHRLDENGESYQQRLNAVSVHEGLLMEIGHFALTYKELLNDWDVNDPDILEVKFDDLMGGDRESLYEQIFEHLGFVGSEARMGCDLMRAFEAQNRTGRRVGETREGSHVRSSESGQWLDVLSEDHISLLEEQLGAIIDKFGFRSRSLP